MEAADVVRRHELTNFIERPEEVGPHSIFGSWSSGTLGGLTTRLGAFAPCRCHEILALNVNHTFISALQ